MKFTGVHSRAPLGRPVLADPALTTGCAEPSGAQAQEDAIASEQAMFELVNVVGGLEHPWGMAFLPGGEILVTERPGRLRIIREGVLEPEPIAGVPPFRASGQGGLLDVALDPDFASNRVIYLSYAADRDAGLPARSLARGAKGLRQRAGA